MTDEEHKRLTRKGHILIYLCLFPPWLIFLVCIYWYFVDVNSPLTLIYQSPKFSSKEVNTRIEAEQYAINETSSWDTVWIYREICATNSLIGEIDPVWYGNNVILTSPQRPLPPITGCVNKSWPIRVPVVTKTNDFLYRVTIFYSNNPLVHSKIEFPPVPIKILSILKHDEDDEYNELERLKKRVDELFDSVAKLNSRLGLKP